MRSLFLAVLLAFPGPAAAGEVVVVMPQSRTAPHEEALLGVCEALGGCPETRPAGAALPEGARIVVAIGGDAARQRYPAELTLVTALCPGLESRPSASEGPVVRVRMAPSPADFAAGLRARRPEVKRVALLWSARGRGRYVRELRAVLASAGVTADAQRLHSPDDLPALLRGLERPDAVWVAPDPELVTPVSFALLKEYAKAEKAVFLAPAAGLGEGGADAALAPSFRAVGVRAGLAARDALAGREIPEEAYPALPSAAKPDVAVSTSVPGGR
jgi:hypothetical protein